MVKRREAFSSFMGSLQRGASCFGGGVWVALLALQEIPGCSGAQD